MTAEVAILNLRGVALAADSAVTMAPGKVFLSADKLFTLSKYQPVGIMVYGNADIVGVPAETVIKRFRQKLGEASKKKLVEYAQEFLTQRFRQEVCKKISGGCLPLLRDSNAVDKFHALVNLLQ